MPELPDLASVLADLHVVALPLRTRFRGIDVREVALVRGPAGWGEFAPFTEYDDAESAPWLAAGLEAAWWGFPAALRDHVAVNATVPAVRPEQVAAVLDQFPGCTVAKVKVADGPLADDLARVAAVRAAGLGVRVDANGLWSVDEATAALRALAEQGPLEYAEQPCASVEELAAVRAAGTGVRIAADESIRKASDPLRVVRAGAADVAVLKVPPLGGVRRVLSLAAELDTLGVPVVISSGLDSAVGMAAGLAAAAAVPGEALACGLATGGLLAADVTADVRPVGGVLAVGAVVPEQERLTALAAPADRRAWWEQRLRRAHALLAAGHPSWPPPGG
ncbi:o-succinylbenzoate synthase [Rhodococcus antarcticus]|uniref:o-succinylbenzoate synthase n=1 Tax=Rhodococcus antarcticus TaxID=2987751 RepID=A0ABY6P669_9NOCA|nr:o-succinylbenzoate synthase [Rhodococcus antarcticus]UZJ26786.1 o-succinylbenzoate synthase [Rhodococcus antarcticus]